MIFRIVTLAIWLIVGSQRPGEAAEIKVVTTSLCDVALSGRIQVDDATKLINLFKDPPNKSFPAEGLPPISAGGIAPPHRSRKFTRLCLDSPGGNFAEAVKLIKAILNFTRSSHALVTVVEAGKTCKSACALVFMAGRSEATETWPTISLRYMHPTAKVGFHGPLIPEIDEDVEPSLLAVAHRQGVRAVADLLDLDDDLYPRRLLTSFLRIPDYEFYDINTVDDAGRWGIRLFDYQSPKVLDTQQWLQLCQNLSDWQGQNKTEWAQRPDLALAARKEFASELKEMPSQKVSFARGVTWFTFGGFGPDADNRCTVKIERKSRDAIYVKFHKTAQPPEAFAARFQFIEQYPWDESNAEMQNAGDQAWRFYPPQRKLAEIQADIPRGDVWLGPYPDPSIDILTDGSWNFQGSSVAIEVKDRAWTITALSPSTGIQSGAILFKGVQNGEEVSGTAYVQSRNCAPRSFAVAGRIDDSRMFIFEGKPQRMRPRCGQHMDAEDGMLLFQFELRPLHY